MAVRTAANTEAKLLMLTHAFEVWRVLRVCLHTDARNKRSQAAIERIGGKFEGFFARTAWPRTSSRAIPGAIRSLRRNGPRRNAA